MLAAIFLPARDAPVVCQHRTTGAFTFTRGVDMTESLENMATEFEEVWNIVKTIGAKECETPNEAVQDIKMLADCLDRLATMSIDGRGVHSILDMLSIRTAWLHDSFLDFPGCPVDTECAMETPEYLTYRKKLEASMASEESDVVVDDGRVCPLCNSIFANVDERDLHVMREEARNLEVNCGNPDHYDEVSSCPHCNIPICADFLNCESPEDAFHDVPNCPENVSGYLYEVRLRRNEN